MHQPPLEGRPRNQRYPPQIWALITGSETHRWPLIIQAVWATYGDSLCYSSQWQLVIGKWTQQSYLPSLMGPVCFWTPEAQWLNKSPLCLSIYVFRMLFAAKCIHHLSECRGFGSRKRSREVGREDVPIIWSRFVTAHLKVQSQVLFCDEMYEELMVTDQYTRGSLVLS